MPPVFQLILPFQLDLPFEGGMAAQSRGTVARAAPVRARAKAANRRPEKPKRGAMPLGLLPAELPLWEREV